MIAIPHDKWGERPLLVVVAKEGQVCGCVFCLSTAGLHGWHQPAIDVFLVRFSSPLSHAPSRFLQSPTRDDILSYLDGKIAK